MTRRSFFFSVAFLFFSASVAHAQDSYMSRLVQQETIDDGSLEQLYEDLSDRTAEPLWTSTPPHALTLNFFPASPPSKSWISSNTVTVCTILRH
jgi:hypothetical protein